MLHSSGSNELGLTYMPYHEGLINHNVPPMRDSLSVRVSNQQQHHQQSSYYGDSDDDVSDDPVWMSAPCSSLQPPLSPSLMKKASNVSVTDSQTSSPMSNFDSNVNEEDEEKHRKSTSSNNQNDKSTLSHIQSPRPNAYMRREKCDDSNTKLATDPKLQKCSSVPMNQTVTVPNDANKMTRSHVNSPGKWRLPVMKKRSDSPVKDPINIFATEKDGFRESMMRYRPSDLKPQDFTATMMSRDSLAPDNFDASRNSDIFGKSRSSNVFDSSQYQGPFGSSRSADAMSGRGSVLHFGPRVKEEGLSVYLRAVKSGNLQLLRACLEDRKTDITERDPIHGQTAMHIAVRFGQLHAIQVLCEKKTRRRLIDAVDSRQNTPLHLAAAKSRRITKYLLEHGANALRVNHRNQTPLAVHILTTKRDDPLITEMLLQHKTDPNGSIGNSTLLHKAVDLKFFEIAYRLVRYGARLDAKDELGCMVFEKVDQKILRQLCDKISYPPVWVPNTARKSCMSCLRDFSHLGLGTRRHHCRHCGRLVCGRCSHESIEIEAFPASFTGYIDRNRSDERSNLKRVCTTCSSVFDERAKNAKESTSRSHNKWSNVFMCKFVDCASDKIDHEGNNSNFGSSRHRRSLAA
ncbi:hypothetical protein PsorP6_004467 [Peronosclerospora sorghi]|uniref:Uncharacterized protein n=1 Tax=Peronosclerospora sorghi TaxID=230839 RepID=A0ACC0VTB0_9STRA|nr:hypothetical protein PsorP6_004467 [Peronosclerospora sorghi]